nr:hypothetical protein [uncultured Arsenicibacter sp.]
MENNPRVKFGLESQGHIPTIQAMLAVYGSSAEAWELIGRKIGWAPLTACAHYVAYLSSSVDADPSLPKVESNYVVCSKIGTTNLCLGCGAAKAHLPTSCEPCPVHMYNTCQPIKLGVGDSVKFMYCLPEKVTGTIVQIKDDTAKVRLNRTFFNTKIADLEPNITEVKAW